MQTFLPFPDFRESAAALDDRRLGKQRVETLQILRALTWARYGWRNHPAVRMWRGFTRALVEYGVAVCDEWESRGRADAVRGSLLPFTTPPLPGQVRLRDDGELPPWVGWEEVHASHRAALLRKDPHRYGEVFPDAADLAADLPYSWPAAAFPRWPLRRGSATALTLEEALPALGLEQARPEQAAAVRAARAGRSARLQLPRGGGATTAGLLAGLCTPGPTLWVTPGDPVPVTDRRPGPPPEGLPPGKLSPSIAREPAAGDRAAMAAGAAAEPEFRFFRAAQLTPERAAGAGLVVVDEDAGRPDGAPRPRPVLGALGVPVLTLAAADAGTGISV
jgi:Pyrimidine dimer DNA glycosylase